MGRSFPPPSWRMAGGLVPRVGETEARRRVGAVKDTGPIRAVPGLEGGPCFLAAEAVSATDLIRNSHGEAGEGGKQREEEEAGHSFWKTRREPTQG